jgi:adenine/guanine phosphoribosyltransferase-like PRPP-binding protein
MTAAVDGIPLATMIAEAFGVNLVLAKNTKEVGIPDFIEENYIPSNSAVRMVLYIPKKSLKRGDSVLIVDDIIRSGETQKALMKIVSKARAEVAGIYALIGVGENWRDKIPVPSNCPCEVVLTMPISSNQ